MKSLSHLDSRGAARMVDVSDKDKTSRRATAEGIVILGEELVAAMQEDRTPKGNVLETARIAGIMAAKRTSELIPLCHQIEISHVSVEFEVTSDRIGITSTVRTNAATGVEMEALTAVTVAALTIYDMLKALSHEIRIDSVRLLEKSGGKSGSWKNPQNEME